CAALATGAATGDPSPSSTPPGTEPALSEQSESKGRLRMTVLVLLVLPTTIYAHPGHHHLEPTTIMHWWSWEPFVIIPLALTAVLYTIGVIRMNGARKWQIASFAAGWLALVVALV